LGEREGSGSGGIAGGVETGLRDGSVGRGGGRSAPPAGLADAAGAASRRGAERQVRERHTASVRACRVVGDACTC